MQQRLQLSAFVADTKRFAADGTAQPVTEVGKSGQQYFKGNFFCQGIKPCRHLARTDPMLYVAGKIRMPGSHAVCMQPPEPFHANIKANRPALPVSPWRQYRAMRHAQGACFFQINQTGPFIDAAFRQGPGLGIKNTSKPPVIRPCKIFLWCARA